ncbi:hypothetical protein GGS20DRAFT_573517 [Poronia punctata]|nr:hypothetical protein GGS20DRAFT_573517 [Poronia punctata]
MPANRTRPRRHSLSSGDESVHPHPAKPDGLPRQDSRRRARLPRSKSTSAFDAFRRPAGNAQYDVNNIALEQTNVASLRELAKFLRTTGPPPDRPSTHDECLKLSGSGEPRRWSLQSLRRNKRSKLERHSLQSQLPGSAKPGTTAEGHPYIAISTPLPENANRDGPWCRSQYPVYSKSPLNSPAQSPPLTRRIVWPERVSSKGATNAAPDSSVAGVGPATVHPLTGTVTGDASNRVPRAPKPGGLHSRALSHRVSTDQLLRAMLNTVDERSENDLGASLKHLGTDRSPAVEHLSRAPRMQKALSQVAVGGEERGDGIEFAEKGLSDDGASITGSSGNKHSARRRSSLHVKNSDSPRSPGRPGRPPATMSVQTTLAVPKSNIPPESPGFPIMLATMTFPSPPKVSRPSSPASTAASVTENQTPPRSGPMVHPRTSSRRACTSTALSTASLDEIIMQRRPSSLNSKAEVKMGAQTLLSSDEHDGRSSTLPMTARAERPSGHLNLEDNIYTQELSQGLDDGSSIQVPGPKSLAKPCDSCQRVSQTSQCTAATTAYRESVVTESPSSSSSTSSMSARSRSTVTPDKRICEGIPESGHLDPPTPMAREPKTDKAAAQDPVLSDDSKTDNGNAGELEPHEAPKRPNLWLSTMNTESNSQPRSILERRLARKAKVREYKIRDLDASRIGAADSPILGYFAPTLPQSSHALNQVNPAVVHDSRRPSTLSTTTTVSEASNDVKPPPDEETPTRTNMRNPAEPYDGYTAMKRISPSETTHQLNISALLMTDIKPIYTPSPDWHTSGITMSPIMIVADVESQPGSPTLRHSLLPRADLANSRMMSRTKSLKIGPQNRPKPHSITISRNPSTGAIERFALGATDSKLNRRSLINMPTPPMSPDNIHLSRRLSLPPVHVNLPVTSRERTAPSRLQEWQSHNLAKQEPDTRARSATLKARVLREKMQKEKEITDIVARTVGLSHRESTRADGGPSPLPSDGYNAETLEKRLRRLERNNDAWLCAMKPLLEAMARTLEDMRADDRSSSLRMSDFIIDADVESRRFSISQKTRRAEQEGGLVVMQDASVKKPAANELSYRRGYYDPTVLSPVPQELEAYAATSQSPESLALKSEGHDDTDGSPGAPRELDVPGCPVTALSATKESPFGFASDYSPLREPVLNGSKPASLAEVDEANEFSDLDPLIQELGNMTRRHGGVKDSGNAAAGWDDGVCNSDNALNPLMRELMSASRSSKDEVTNFH